MWRWFRGASVIEVVVRWVFFVAVQICVGVVLTGVEAGFEVSRLGASEGPVIYGGGDVFDEVDRVLVEPSVAETYVCPLLVVRKTRVFLGSCWETRIGCLPQSGARNEVIVFAVCNGRFQVG